MDSPRVLGNNEGEWPQYKGAEQPLSQDNDPAPFDVTNTPEPTDTPSPYTVPVPTKKSATLCLNRFDDRQYCEVTPLPRQFNTWSRSHNIYHKSEESNLDQTT